MEEPIREAAIDNTARIVKEENADILCVVEADLVRRQQWLPLHRIGACLHLNFGQVLDWTYNQAHENHFHVEIMKDSPKQRQRFIDRALSWTLGASLVSLGWVPSHSAHASYAPGDDVARLRALQQFAGRVPAEISSLFMQRFGRPWSPSTWDMNRLVILNVARNGFRL